MANKKVTGSETEEYREQEEDFSSEYSDEHKETLTSDKPGGSWRSGKRLLMPIVLIVVITLVYQFLNWYSNRSGDASAKQEAVVAQKTIQSASALSQLKSAEIGLQPGSAIADSAADLPVQQKLDILASSAVSNTEQLTKIGTSVAQTETVLTSLNQNVGSLSKSVQSLSSNVQHFSAPSKVKAAATKVKKTPRKKRIVKKDVPPRVIYHVKAIVPGLAWLEDSDGDTVAVRVGDKLEGYGDVRLISPKQGMVITSSGAVIQYGVNDF